jgi:hypothetical protein
VAFWNSLKGRPSQRSLHATKEEPSTSTWSRKVTSVRSNSINNNNNNDGSRFGVRKRVKAVLQKARNRTGVRNSSDTVNDDLVVSQAASLAGYTDQDADFVYQKKSPAAALRNGTDTELVLVRTPLSTTTSSTRRLPTSISPTPTPADNFLSADTGIPDSDDSDNKPIEPLPFALPNLSSQQRRALANGERIQEQSKMGREGSGYVVLDVEAPPYVVWECLLDFEAYPENIGTVRSMRIFTNTHLKSSYIAEKPLLPGTGKETRHYGNASVTRANFVLSKFQLNIAAIHKYVPHPDGHFMEFTLDKACKNVVLQDAKGIWHTQSNPDGRGAHVTRVWLLCEVKVSSVLPSFIVEYTAKRAMPRATTWLRPLVEQKASQWLRTPTPLPPLSNGAEGGTRVNGESRSEQP